LAKKKCHSFIEITAETLQELQKPEAWLHCTKDIVLGSVKFVSNVSIWSRLANSVLSNRLMQIAILLIILLAIVVMI